jgi:ubiquinone/menaquinone biosynthesis C-methylase UbiE
MLRKLHQLITKTIAPGANGKAGRTNQAAREAWLEKTLSQIPSGHRILDAGAGELQYKRFCQHLNYVSQDFSQYDGSGNKSGLQTGTWDNTKLDIVSDIAKIPLPEASFDAIMCVEVLEHIPHPVDALRELTRLLKRDGILILTSPFASLTHFAPYHFQTGYSRYFYEHWLGVLGYAIEDMDFNGNYFECLAQEVRRLPEIAERYSGPRLSRMETLAQEILLNGLARLSKQDRGSRELLVYGFHVRARKI